MRVAHAMRATHGMRNRRCMILALASERQKSIARGVPPICLVGAANQTNSLKTIKETLINWAQLARTKSLCTRRLIKRIRAKRVVLQRGRHYYYYYIKIFIYISPKAISHTSVAGGRTAILRLRVQNR